MRVFIFSSILFFITINLAGQSHYNSVRSTDALNSLKEKELNGQVTLHVDSLIEANYTKHLISNSKMSGESGYRIRIFSNNGLGAKDEQKRVRARFMSLFPEIPSYNPYEGTYYKLYVGDFRTKREAIKMLKDIKRKFPEAFIVEYNIVIED